MNVGPLKKKRNCVLEKETSFTNTMKLLSFLVSVSPLFAMAQVQLLPNHFVVPTLTFIYCTVQTFSVFPY